jgi:hypothetical protein
MVQITTRTSHNASDRTPEQPGSERENKKKKDVLIQWRNKEMGGGLAYRIRSRQCKAAPFVQGEESPVLGWRMIPNSQTFG